MNKTKKIIDLVIEYLLEETEPLNGDSMNYIECSFDKTDLIKYVEEKLNKHKE